MRGDPKEQLTRPRYKAEWSDQSTRLQVIDCEYMGYHRNAESEGRGLDHQIKVLEAPVRFQGDPLVFRGA
jgi:hypothetical protein